MTDAETDPLDDVVARLTAMQVTERGHANDLQRWWNILVNNWANEIRSLIKDVNGKLRPFNFQIVDVRWNKGVGAKAKIEVLAFAEVGFHGSGQEFPSLQLSIDHSGEALISCRANSEALVDERLPLDGPVPKQELRRLLALYAEKVIERRVGPQSRK